MKQDIMQQTLPLNRQEHKSNHDVEGAWKFAGLVSKS